MIGFILFQRINNPHLCKNIADSFINHDNILLAEIFVKKGIKENTLENIKRTYHDMHQDHLEHRLNSEYGWLYSQYSWIKYKKKKLNEANNYIQKALEYKDISMKAEPIDWIRFGIINYETGNKETGWNSILKALLEDSYIENKDSGIKLAITKIVKERTTINTDLDDYLEKIRYENAEVIPNMDIIISDSIKSNMHDFIGKTLIVMYFSPACGSCRQELSNIFDLYEQQKGTNTKFIFILNQPKRMEQAKNLFNSYNIKSPTIAILDNTNAYDLIKAEPTTWIVNKEGKIIYKHVGYQQGDEKVYSDEIDKLAEY